MSFVRLVTFCLGEREVHFPCCVTFSVRLVRSLPCPEAAGWRETIHGGSGSVFV